jgi:hypothetical protein
MQVLIRISGEMPLGGVGLRPNLALAMLIILSSLCDTSV